MNSIIHIAGGGISGLALGLALRRTGAPVAVHEAATYPRHRLCGEFISGAGEAEFAALGLTDLAATGTTLTDVAWFSGDRLILRRALPEPARGISRWRLDAGMAEKFTAAGGALHCGQRVTPPVGAEGWVLATGRLRAEESPWFAQKEHFQNLPLSAGLEMHMGRGGYAGIARVEDGLANLCALLPAAVGKSAATLPDRVRACGLTALAARLEAAQPVEASRCGVASFRTGWQPHEAPLLSIGDHCALIPPFTGHGMSMAILAALDAAPPLEAWSRGRLAWPDTVAAVRTALHRRFHSRLRWAAWLHPLLLRPAGQSALRLLARCGLLPWHWLYHKVR